MAVAVHAGLSGAYSGGVQRTMWCSRITPGKGAYFGGQGKGCLPIIRPFVKILDSGLQRGPRKFISGARIPRGKGQFWGRPHYEAAFRQKSGLCVDWCEGTRNRALSRQFWGPYDVVFRSFFKIRCPIVHLTRCLHFTLGGCTGCTLTGTWYGVA